MKWILYSAWLIAFASFLGSLYYGEVLGFEPCRLCWYQRIAMFPLALLLGVATYRKDASIIRYCLPLALIGGFVALTQSMGQLFPSLHLDALCGESTPCTKAGVAPFFSFFSFGSIGAVLFLGKKFLRNSEKQ